MCEVLHYGRYVFMPFNDYEIAGAPAAADVGTAKRRAEYQAQLRVRTPGVRVADSQ